MWLADFARPTRPTRLARLARLARRAGVRRADGDIDVGEQFGGDGLPAAAVQDAQPSPLPGRVGGRDGEGRMVAVDQDRLGFVHQRRQVRRGIKGTARGVP